MKLVNDKMFPALQYVVADNIHSSDVAAIFTTRKGGVSGTTPETEHLYSLNLKFDYDDDDEDHANVMENYNIVASSQGFRAKNVFALWQNHTDKVIVITETLIASRPAAALSPLDEIADALITNVPNILISVRTADCVPIFFYDEKHKAVGAAHAGWQGTFKQIGAKTINRMTEVYGTNPADIQVAVGPAAEVCCYEVGVDFYENFRNKYGDEINRFFTFEPNKKPHCNLKAMNKAFLVNAGVKAENITVSDYCTICNPELFYSFRRNGKKRGIMASLIGIR